MKIYIAGPMSGLRGFNRDSFAIAESHLKEQGHEVRNPACLLTDWAEYQDYIEVGMVMLRQCEAIVMLPGSDASKGARQETQEAGKHAILNVSMLLHPVWDELRETYVANVGGVL